MIVAKVVINCQGKILVLNRSKTHPRYALQFDLPGGEVEDGETGPQATAREVKEEIGLSVPASNFKLEFEYLANDYKHEIYKLDLESPRPEILLSWEHVDYNWLSREGILSYKQPANMDPFFKTVTNYLKSL
jgi:mutator protein MutT